ncbi:uncharacterized protein SPPG_00500 [Spizellomyces punctatus DAOM BR117]|uniref:Uncharacterized protein n=1 Tax=Spizellomyces punctatus (strain DAOM BR117) TaxID=645134 RepID=A0A0L0HUM2_SPIPD|nr:uncharacterized protein SPPG_00500 [Spizellomyces punctatus DAOM BR117]KND04797.1 hypothetical protein SPPG_00500 [Spizellomyces punctatus DAOM BR117]|eukprot:XP_016612836.1 hypothetical protein SPPG_00500 [Spizellomyces punctatus DAOM BR117]
MAGKVSSAKGKGGATKSRQKYQNTFAYKPHKKDTVALKIAALPAKGLCQRCLDIVDWRKRMNKYKPLTQPKTCVGCKQKKVTDAYHVLCKSCAEEKNVCAKCQESTDVVTPDIRTPADILREEQDQERLLASMSERQRRSYLRRVARGDDEGAQKVVLAAEKNEDGGWSDFDDFDDEEEDEEDDDA